MLNYCQKIIFIFFFLSLFFLSSPESFGQSYTKTNVPHTIAALSNPIRVYDGAFGSYDDTYSSAISLPFNFQFFGRSVSQFYLSTNGIMFFSNPSTRFTASSIPTADDVNDMIAVWNDLYVVSGTGHYVQHKTIGTAPNRVLIVDYNVAYYSDRNASARFQFKLHEGSNIIEQHVSILSYGATVGIENADGTEGYGTNYTSGVTNFAYRYTPSSTIGALTLAADSVAGLPGTQVVVPVKVSDFRNIVTAQGSINFNPSVASFVGVERMGLPNLSSANFGTSQAGNGIVTFSWDDQTLAGVSLTDNATIFALRFNVTGAAGSRTPVSFINTPTPVEFTDAAFTTRNAILNNGQISVPVNYITTSPISGNTFCGGSTVNIAFTAGGVYNAGNTFTAQLSDANGSFNAPLTIGSGSQSPITATLPVTASGSSYRIRVVSSSPSITGTDNGSNIAITSAPASPTATGGAICGFGSVTLSASGAPTGGSYRWYTTASGGMPISGATSATYTTPYLTATTTYYVAAVNSNGCESTRTPATATINAIPTAPAITSNSPVAEGGTLNLTASSVTGAIYNWTGPNGFTSQSQNPIVYNVTAANAGTYNLTVTVNGCTSTPVSTHVSLLYTISGTIQSETGSPINGVTVSASDGTATQSMVTSDNGSYSFDLAQANMHTISPVKNNDVVMNNGITTSDIALIRRHILGIADLPSPYKILAADVDYSSNVTTADIAQIRSIVLAINNSFPNGRNWAFVPSNYIFADPTNPFPFASESYLYSNLTTSLTNQDFIGLKLGDVNNTWDNTVARLASFGQINVELPQRQVQQNTEISVPVRFSDFKDISGYQFTLEWDSKVLEFIGTENGALTAAYGTHRTAEGKLTTTWDDQQGTSMSLSDTATVFNLKFRVKGAPGTFSPLVVSSALTKAEAYNGQLKQMRVNSSVGQVEVKRLQEDMLPGGYALYQSYPNPAIGSVYIAFDLPENQDVEIILYTTLGQKVNHHRGNYPAGEHRVQFDVSNLAAGTYLYQITAGSFAQAKRMVVIK